MTQSAFMRASAASVFERMRNSPFPGTTEVNVDYGSYTPDGGSAVSGIWFKVNRGTQRVGDGQSQVIEPVITITVQRADVDNPAEGGVFAVTVTGESFTVDAIQVQDESLTVCVVTSSAL